MSAALQKSWGPPRLEPPEPAELDPLPDHYMELADQPRRESASQIDEFFTSAARRRSSFTAILSALHGRDEDDVFVKPEPEPEPEPEQAPLAGLPPVQLPPLPPLYPSPLPPEPRFEFTAPAAPPPPPPHPHIKCEPGVYRMPTAGFAPPPTPQGYPAGYGGSTPYPSLRCYLPPTPPHSDPGSASPEQLAAAGRRTPPPPYRRHVGWPTPHHPLAGAADGRHLAAAAAAASAAQSTPQTTEPRRYNRRNNPELEKRRIHRCHFTGETPFRRPGTETGRVRVEGGLLKKLIVFVRVR